MFEDILSLTEWKKKKIILSEMKSKDIKINERQFRKHVEINNRLYGQGKVDYYICHSQKGYKFSFNWDEIKESIADKRKRALTMLAECSNAEKQYQRRNNLKMEDYKSNE